MSFDIGPDVSYGWVFRPASGVLNGDIPPKEIVCSEEAASASTPWQQPATEECPMRHMLPFREGTTPP